MSGMTPEAARMAAEWLEGCQYTGRTAAQMFRHEADRLEAAAKTPGQVLAETCGNTWQAMSREAQVLYGNYADAVIAAYVVPDRVVVDREDAAVVATHVCTCAAAGYNTATAGARLREALS